MEVFEQFWRAVPVVVVGSEGVCSGSAYSLHCFRKGLWCLLHCFVLMGADGVTLMKYWRSSVSVALIDESGTSLLL